MQEKTYLWLEDKEGKSSYTFWKRFMSLLFPEVIVESKKNNSGLVKAVKNIEDNNKYIVMMDNSFDNPEVFRELSRLKKYAAGKNVVIVNLICFEYILLEFADLINWIYAENDELKNRRGAVINVRNLLVDNFLKGNLDYKQMKEIAEYDTAIQQHNIEQLSAKLLFDLTRNTGFEVSKGTLGECWLVTCCEWNERQDDDICGLDKLRLNIVEKMKTIYNKTSLKVELTKAGLEVIV